MPAPSASEFRGLPRVYWVLWLGMLVNRLGGFVIPFLALYLTQERRLPVEQVGFIVAALGAGSVAAGPLGGLVADRVGRRVAMLAGLAGGAAAMLHLGFARHPQHIAAAAFVLGLVGDLYRPAVWATVGDVVPPPSRLRAFGLLYWAVNLGFAGASVLAGLFASAGFWLLFAGDAATSLAMAAIVLRYVPESRPARLPGRQGALGSIAEPFGDGVFMAFVALSFVTAMMFMQFTVALPLDIRNHGLSSREYGAIIALNGVLIVVVQPFVMALLGRFRRSHVLAAAALLCGVGFGLTARASTVAQYMGTVAVWTLGEILMAPLTPAVVADLAPVSLRATYQGVQQMSWGAASCFAPIVGAAMLARFGAAALWTSCFALGVLVAAAHLAIAGPRRERLAALRAGLEPRADGQL